MTKTRLVLALCAAIGPALSRAHELWLERSGGELVLQAGHPGEKTSRIDPASIRSIRCARAGEEVQTLAPPLRADGGTVRVPARCDAASVSLDLGFFVLTPDGEKHARRSEAPDAVKSWRARQFAKWVDVASAAAATPLGDALEMVPVTELSRARVGEKVTVRVLLDGHPAPGAIVSLGHHALAETGSSGEARVKVRHAGLESISATVRRPLGTPDAETDLLEASLSFEVPR
jgi:nickel transport protein